MNINLLETLESMLDSVSVKRALDRGNALDRVGDFSDLVSAAMLKAGMAMQGSNFYIFNGWYYEHLERRYLESVFQDLMTRFGMKFGDAIAYFGKAFSACERKLYRNQLEVRPELVCFKNCVLNVNTEEVLKFSAKNHVICKVDYDYSPNLVPNRWLRFLKEVLGDEDKISILQEFLGMVFIDRRIVKFEYMLFLLGNGSNGKSVVFETVMGVLGRNNVTNFDIAELTSSADALKNKAVLENKRLNYCGEISSRELSNSAFKSLVSGEPQRARANYGNPFNIYNIPLMMANANRMPSTKDTSDGVYRRIVILPFDVSIPVEEQDRLLSNKMVKDYPGIFNWIMEGRKRMIENNYRFTRGKGIVQMVEDYKLENNSVYQWVKMKGYETFGKEEKMTNVMSYDLFTDYTSMCTKHGMYKENIQIFGKVLTEMGFIKKRSADGFFYKIYKK